ncbi:MAG: asparagine synthase (glutamine-hydrolyzing) [Planctomycetia bacterium]|nr:asparagine synthase (glutamine-hydrolyzing) [Planctomycetia bacterium]
MCGICGIAYRDPRRQPDAAVLRRMAATIRHRGPDDEGCEVLGPVGLSFRRLSIIDLSPAGHQPMANEDGTVWIIFNGEIYNFQELHADLVGRHRFRSRSDTEVLVHLYEERGPAMVDAIDGMFAFAIHDRKRKSLFLARDPFGIKPLFYALDDNRLVFGSEIKPILASGEVSRQVDRSALNDYFDFHWIPAPRSIFADIRKLPHAHTLELDLDSWQSRSRRYWRPRYAPQDGKSLDTWVDEVDEVLGRSVKSQLVSDVPLGLFLSGGIDSSLVTLEASKAGGGPLRTFTIGFEDDALSEVPYARQVAEDLKTEAVYRTLPYDSLEQLPALTEFYDEPFADPSQLPTSAVSRVAREYVTVALSGDGGDELFSGYRHHKLSKSVSRLDVIPAAVARVVFGGVARLAPVSTRAHDWGRRFALSSDERRMSIIRLPGRELRADVLAPHQRECPEARLWHMREHVAELRGLPPVTQTQLYDLLMYLPNDMLVKVDRASMACSLEARVPFLSRAVAELAFRIPEHVRFEGATEKRVLRRLAARRFGDTFARRRKQGFGIPLQSWMAAAAHDARLQDRVQNGPAVHAGMLDAQGVGRLFARVRQGGGRILTDRSDELFALLVFDAWWNRYAA